MAKPRPLLGLAAGVLAGLVASAAMAAFQSGTKALLPDEDGDEEPEDAPDPILRYSVVVRVERDSQKGIVIGKGGVVIRDAGTKARLELEHLFGARVYLETRVRVDPDWQRRAHALDRLGL